MADCLVAKAKVAGSNPVFRSKKMGPAVADFESAPGPCFSGVSGCLAHIGHMARPNRRRERSFGGRREQLERRAQVLVREVAVGVHRRADVGVAEDALDVLDGDAGLEQERRGGVADVMEAHRPRDRARPHAHVAGRAAPLLGVRELVRRRLLPGDAAPAGVAVADDHARADQDAVPDLLHCRALGALRSNCAREHEFARCTVDGMLEEGLQRCWDGQHDRLLALGRVGCM